MRLYAYLNLRIYGSLVVARKRQSIHIIPDNQTHARYEINYPVHTSVYNLIK